MGIAHDPCSPTRITAYRHPGSDSESCCSAKARARSERTRSQQSGQRAGEGPGWLGIVGELMRLGVRYAIGSGGWTGPLADKPLSTGQLSEYPTDYFVGICIETSTNMLRLPR